MIFLDYKVRRHISLFIPNLCLITFLNDWVMYIFTFHFISIYHFDITLDYNSLMIWDKANATGYFSMSDFLLLTLCHFISHCPVCVPCQHCPSRQCKYFPPCIPLSTFLLDWESRQGSSALLFLIFL